METTLRTSKTEANTNGTIKNDKYHIQPEAMNIDERTVVLNHSDSFAILDRWGNILPVGKQVQGIYCKGTRFVNNLLLLIDNKKPLLLSSTIKENNNIFSVDLTNPVLREGKIQENTIHIFRHQFLRENVFFEKITCVNYGEDDCSFELGFLFEGDFKDIFEIRGMPRKYASPSADISAEGNSVELSYIGIDNISRRSIIKFTAPGAFTTDKNICRYPVFLKTGEETVIHYSIHFVTGEKQPEKDTFDFAKKMVLSAKQNAEAKMALIESDNPVFQSWLNRSYSDLFSLYAPAGNGHYLFAGVPWYNTPFGRDGIITAMETLWLAPHLAKDVLQFLASTQASSLLPADAAEPGKIMHEFREGEMANTGEIPFKAYYGTADATPLFLMLAGMYFKRTNDLMFLKSIWENILKALEWIDGYGDKDGDGFVEYDGGAKTGLSNQGWKDSVDSIMHSDGSPAKGAVALCEVQGYVYCAKRNISTVALAIGKKDIARKLKREARLLKKKFNDLFWDEALQYYVLALDGEKRPCRVVASNAAHCLYTGIAEKRKAGKVAVALFSEDMYSGWGIRTLSAHSKKYNPMSYHNGSVWPHDNALAAYGLAAYGYKKKALRIFEGFFEASVWMDLHRLPELFCGFDKRKFEGPTQYPVACSPQAWSVASVYMYLQSCLGIYINAVKKSFIIHKPILPDYIEDIHIMHLPIESAACNVHLTRRNNEWALEVSGMPEQWSVIFHP